MSSYKLRKKLDKLSNNREWTNILDRLILNVYNKDKYAYDKAREECIEKNIDPLIVDKCRIIEPSKMDILPDKETKELFVFLKSRYPNVNKKDLTNCVNRYATLGMHGQQWASDHTFMEKVRAKGITIEAFASPFNRYFTKYCSLFKDDYIFGSLGNFFDQKDETFADGVYVNPPFTPYILDKMSKKVCNYKKAIIVTPTWIDAEWYTHLRNCGFEPTIITNKTYTALNLDFVPKFKTTVWTKGVTF